MGSTSIRRVTFFFHINLPIRIQHSHVSDQEHDLVLGLVSRSESSSRTSSRLTIRILYSMSWRGFCSCRLVSRFRSLGESRSSYLSPLSRFLDSKIFFIYTLLFRIQGLMS